MVQWLRLQAPSAEGLGSIPGQGTRSHMPQLRVCVQQFLKNDTRTFSLVFGPSMGFMHGAEPDTSPWVPRHVQDGITEVALPPQFPRTTGMFPTVITGTSPSVHFEDTFADIFSFFVP